MKPIFYLFIFFCLCGLQSLEAGDKAEKLQGQYLASGELGLMDSLAGSLKAKIAKIKEYHMALLPRLEKALEQQKLVILEITQGKSDQTRQEKNIKQIKRALEQVNPQQPKASEVKELLEASLILQDKSLRWLHRPYFALPRAEEAGVKITKAIELLKESQKKQEQDQKDQKENQKNPEGKKQEGKDKKGDEQKQKDKKKQDSEKSKQKQDKGKPEASAQSKAALDKIKEIQAKQAKQKKLRRKALGLPATRPTIDVEQDW